MSEFYGSFDEKKSIQTLYKAVERGVDFFDTADILRLTGRGLLTGARLEQK